MLRRTLSLDIYITGIVQGVGFRPFIKRIALKKRLKGYIRNLGGGEVKIHLYGDIDSIRGFFKELWLNNPTPSEIYSIKVEVVDPYITGEFDIKPSGTELHLRSIIPPDISICNECIKEIDDPNSRWYMYPFNSCAWCGPRFSMIRRIPYDRPNTAMDRFPLCRECYDEYTDVKNERRFHAQGISCPKCGPKIWLTDNKGNILSVHNPIRTAAKLIDKGYIIGIKGIGGFHIACRADSDDIVMKLRMRKRRGEKPFALMALNIEIVKKIAYVNDDAIKLLLSRERPIVILPKRGGSQVSDLVAPGLDSIGIMLPYSGIHYILLKEAKWKYMIMTSGNYYEKPMETTNEGAINRIGEIVDYFLMHNREIVNRVDDSVIRFTGNNPVFLRRSRGYAPKWILLKKRLYTDVVALGAELQNVGGIGYEDKAILTQYIGDTDKLENLMELERILKWFINTYKISLKDSYIIIDKHPQYASRYLGERIAEQSGSEILEVQHHVAHGYSIMAEYGYSEGVAITIDGVGYGDDGNIWGGEVLILYDDGDYRRAGRIKYYKMLGGDLATIYPVRMLYSILAEALGPTEAYHVIMERKLEDKFGIPIDNNILESIYSRERILTSSIGRVLDAFSALLNLCWFRSYEGEPPMKLEAYSRRGRPIEWLFNKVDIYTEGLIKVIDPTLFINEAIDLIWSREASTKDLGYTFQYILGYRLGEVAAEAALEESISNIFLTGGAAVNEIIYKGVKDSIKRHHRKLMLLLHRMVPPGDGGIALGQIYYAAHSI